MSLLLFNGLSSPFAFHLTVFMVVFLPYLFFLLNPFVLCPSFSCPYSSSLMMFPSVFCSISSVDFYCYNSSYFQVVALEFAVCISISTHWINIILSLYNVNTLRNQNLFILFVFFLPLLHIGICSIPHIIFY